MPCSGGVPVWVPSRELRDCDAALCLAQRPVEFRSRLKPICDRRGNAALMTGHMHGWLDDRTDVVPVFFKERLQVLPCHSGAPRWLYQSSTRACLPGELARCRGPEVVPRVVGRKVADASSVNALFASRGSGAGPTALAPDVQAALYGLHDDDGEESD